MHAPRPSRQAWTNVEFSVMDIRDASESFGEVDYIIAHGVYAWVLAPVRDALMRWIDWALAQPVWH
jgi:hypothetical protein